MNLLIVGAGWAGERHVLAARALQRMGENVRVAALVDADADHLASRATEWNIPAAHTDLSAALDAHPDAQAVVIATPHNLHRLQTEQAAAAGRHVLVEKPIALTLEDADAMIAACDAAGTTLMVAESLRYQQGPMAIAAALADNRIGQVLTGRMNMIGTGHKTFAYPGRRAWLADPAAGGSGIWMLNGIHQMSAARMYCGEVVEIDAREVRSRDFAADLEATVVALVRFDSGAVLTMTVSAELHGYKRFGDTLLFGSDGTLHAPRSPAELHIYTNKEDPPETIECPDDEIEGAPGHFVRQMREFLAAIAQNRAPFTSGRSERNTLAAILAGYESIRTRMPVSPAGI